MMLKERVIMLEKKTFEISNIQNVDELNALSLALNAKEQVSHMKIGKDNIVFHCIDIDALLSLIQSINKEFVVKEVIDGQKRQYDFAQKKEKKHYFMFKNIMSEDDLLVLTQRIEEDERFHDVEYDKQNRVLMLISDQKDVLAILRKELYKINPSTIIVEHRRPIRSSDVFDQKFIRNYIYIGILLVIIALAVITSKDHTWITAVMWLATALLFAKKTIQKAWQYIRQWRFFEADVMFLFAIVMGVVSGAYIETCVTVILYQFIEPILSKIMEHVLERIDKTVEMPEKGIRINGELEEEISLYDFSVHDVMLVHPQETIHIPGIIQKGQSKVNTYSNTSSSELVEVSKGDRVHSGYVNAGDEDLYIEITKVYENSHFIELMNIASTAPVYESKVEKYVKKLSRFFKPTMFLISLIIGVVLPLIDYKEYSLYIHVGAVFMILACSFMSEQSTSLSMLSGFAKAFESGIIIESSKGLDSINATQTIVYDRFDGVEVTEEELELFKKLSHMGRSLVIFNDGPVALENDQYTIYNDLTVEEKLELMDSFIGPIVYIGDSFKDIALLQKSYVGISRGGMSDYKVVENSDIVLIDSQLNKVYETFLIARRMRTNAIINNIITLLVKTILLIAVISFTGLPLWLALIVEILMSVLVLNNSTMILG